MFLLLYSLVPFILLIIFNFIFIYVLYIKKNQSTSSSNNKETKLIKTIIAVTILFIVFTLPTASIQGKVYTFLYSTELGQLCILLCNSFTFTYQGNNLLLLYLTNKQFVKEIKSIFNRNRISRISSKTFNDNY